MRIIAGKYKGLQIEAPKGLEVRPTTDRVREAMFSSLISLIKSFDDTNALDAFAGSGAFALESISRGAKFATLFERNKNTCKTIRKNVDFLGVNGYVKLWCSDVEKFDFKILEKDLNFNIVFCDPPYKMPAKNVLDLLCSLKNNEKLADSSIIIYEHNKDENFDEINEKFKSEGFCLKKSKIYGNTACEFLEYC